MGVKPEWDFNWDYTKGLFVNNGCRLNGEGKETLVSDGVELDANGSTTAVKYIVVYAPVEKIDFGVMEMDFTIENAPFLSSIAPANFRPSIGGDANNVGILHVSETEGGFLTFNDNTRPSQTTQITSYSINTRYLLRITLKPNREVKIERNNLIVFDGTAPECLYSNATRLCQQGLKNSKTVVHAWRIKYNRL